MCMYGFINVCIRVRMSVCMYVCVYVYVHVCTGVCMYGRIGFTFLSTIDSTCLQAEVTKNLTQVIEHFRCEDN